MNRQTKNLIDNLTKKAGFRIVSTRKDDDSELYIKYYSEESVRNRMFFNICAGGHLGFGGGFYHPCWTNIDVIRPVLNGSTVFNPKMDITHDLLEMEPLPIETETAEIIQSQYAIEHITTSAAKYFLKEVYRTLKPGGVFKVVTPNIELDYMAYKNKDRRYYSWIGFQSKKEISDFHGYKIPLSLATLEQVALVHFAANASTIHIGANPQQISDEEFIEVMNTMKMEDAYDYCVDRCSVEIQKKYRTNHINWWNHEKLKDALTEAGFKRVHFLAPGQSSAYVLRNRHYFDNLWNDVALFVEAIKD